MSQITDLTGTKWEFNSELADYTPLIYAYDATAWYEDGRDVFEIGPTGINAGYLNFTSNNENFVGLVSFDYAPLEGGNSVQVYDSDPVDGSWLNQSYRIIEITGGTDATNPDLISWLQSNATQIIEPEPEEDPKISIGASPLVSASVGNAEVQAIWVGNVKVWEKTEPTTYDITVTVTNGASSGDTTIQENGSATVTITADSGYELPSSVTVSGATYAYDSTTGVITLSEPTGAVSISVVCESSEWGGTDLTGTTWEFKQSGITRAAESRFATLTGSVEYVYNGSTYTSDLTSMTGNVRFQTSGNIVEIYGVSHYTGVVSSGTPFFTQTANVNGTKYTPSKFLFSITGGDSATDAIIIAWLEANATLISW